MICPKCGNKNALPLLTSFQCPSMSCKNYSQELACEIWVTGIAKLNGTKIGRFSSREMNFSNKPNWDGFLKKKYLSDLRAKGHTINKISSALGLSKSTIRRILYKPKQ